MATEAFTPPTEHARSIEQRAIQIKTTYGYAPLEAIDPTDLARRMGVVVVSPTWLSRLPNSLRAVLLGAHRDAWSAGSIVIGGTTYVVLNPTHSRNRQSPTLMEELVHIALEHPKSILTRSNGISIRTCDRQVESEAYAVAVALLIPYKTLLDHLQSGGSLDSIPAMVPTSEQCRLYRIKKAGLWRAWTARSGNPPED